MRVETVERPGVHFASCKESASSGNLRVIHSIFRLGVLVDCHSLHSAPGTETTSFCQSHCSHLLPNPSAGHNVILFLIPTKETHTHCINRPPWPGVSPPGILVNNTSRSSSLRLDFPSHSTLPENKHWLAHMLTSGQRGR